MEYKLEPTPCYYSTTEGKPELHCNKGSTAFYSLNQPFCTLTLGPPILQFYTSATSRSLCTPFFLLEIISVDGWPALAHLIHPFLSFRKPITGGRRTLLAVSQGLPTKGEEETGGEIILSEGEGGSPAHQSFKEAPFSWSWVLNDYHESLPPTEEWQHHLIV